MSFFYLAEIQLCKLKAEAFADQDHASGDKNITVFLLDGKGTKLVNKNEILADGRMYDIVKTQVKNGKILYYTLADKDEDSDIHRLSDLEKNNAGERSLPGKSMKLYDAKYFTIENQHQNIEHCNYLSPASGGVDNAGFYKSPLADIFVPPPDHLFS